MLYIIIVSLHCRIKEILGYDPEELHVCECFLNLLHPAEYSDLMAKADDLKGKSSTNFFVLVS